jgi:hypothetical protein
MASDTNRLLRATDETEKFYKSKDYVNRPPSILKAEFEKMQDEAFRIQRDLYMKIKDFEMLDLDIDTIADILKEANINKKIVNNLVDGVFTPINYSKPRFESKVKVLEGVTEQKNKNSKNFLYSLNEDFVFPQDELDDVIDNYEDKEFFPSGYEPAEARAIRDAKGNIVYDERGNIKSEPSLLDKVVPKIKNLVVPGSPFSQAPSQTPLPETPGVDARQFVSNTNVSPTGLTPSENAYLTNEEKTMRLKNKGAV